MKKIHIVEDDMVQVFLLKKIIELIGHEVVSSSKSCDKTLKEVAKTEPDLILMDIVIEGDMDGITCVKEINKRHNIPIVYITGCLDPDIHKLAMATKHQAILTKPIVHQDLAAVIQDIPDY